MGEKNSRIYQQQIQKQNENQEEALIKYYVYQDLQNLINLIYSRKAVLEHFQDDPNNSLVTLSNNKIILQLNLSIGIHKDLKQQYSGTNLSGKLNEERQKAYKILKEETSSFESQVSTSNQNKALIKDPIENYLKTFTKNYEYGTFELNQFQLQDSKYAPQFNEQVLSKLISSIQTIDAQINQVSTNGNYHIPTPEQLKQRAKEYYNMTKEKLNQIDPNNNTTLFNNNQFQSKRSLPVNDIGSSPSNSEQAKFNNKKESQIFGNISSNQQFSSNSDQLQSNNKQESLSQDERSFIADGRGIQEKLNSSNSEQEQYLITSDANIEKEELILFFKVLGYFQANQPFFVQQVKDLVDEANKIIKQNSLSYPEKEFVTELQKQNGVVKLLIQIHYYFELFLDYCKEKRPLKNLESIRKFVTKTKNIGLINTHFFLYLITKKELIRRFFSSKTSMNNSQAQDEYVWEMYKGYCEYYKIKKE